MLGLNKDICKVVNLLIFSLVYLVHLFYNQNIIDPCGTHIQSQVNTGINIGIIYN